MEQFSIFSFDDRENFVSKEKEFNEIKPFNGSWWYAYNLSDEETKYEMLFHKIFSPAE